MPLPIPLGQPLGGIAPAVWDNAGDLINEAAAECFGGSSPNPYASTDPNFVQLCQFLRTVGRDLLRRKEWTHLQAAYSFTTALNQARYSLPLDFGRMIDQTAWNRTNRLPMGGPISAQGWEYLKAKLVGVVFTVLFRPIQQQIWVYPDTSTPAGYNIAFEYISRWWCIPTSVPTVSGSWQASTAYILNTYVTSAGQAYYCSTAGTSGTNNPTGTGVIVDGTAQWTSVSASGTDQPTGSTDIILFDPQLVVSALKLRFLEAKGFDISAAMFRFQEALEQAMGDDSQAPTLNLGGGTGTPLLGQQSIPVTGFGQ